MSSHQEARVYTCDICERTSLDAMQVLAVTVTFSRPSASTTANARTMEVTNVDVCRACLGTARVDNPSPKYDDAAIVRYHEANGVARRFLAWLFQPTDAKEETR